MKKKINESAVATELREGSVHFRPAPSVPKKTTSKSTPKVTRQRDKVREVSSDKSREKPLDPELPLPTRDEVQEFSFRLRDELKVKVQAEVPHTWQKELEEVARTLDVKKLELYRFIFGEFLGKVKRKRPS
jgi:hypothetical protein